MNKNDVKIIKQVTAYQGHFRVEKFTIQYRLFEGGWSKPIEREVFERGASAAVLLFDPTLDQVVLLEQFRIGALREENTPWLIEIVAGTIDNEHESPMTVIEREAFEETGMILLDLHPITNIWVSPGACSERTSIFCAKVDASQAGGIHGLIDEGENIRVLTMACKDAFELVTNGRITHAASIIALQWLQLNHDTLRLRWI